MKYLLVILSIFFLLNPLLGQEQVPKELPDDDKALLVVVRPYGTPYVFSTTLNNELLGLTRGAQFLYKNVDPGTIELLTAGGEGHHSLSLEVEAGQIYFVKIRTKAGIFAPRIEMKVMDNEWGWKKVQKLKAGMYSPSKNLTAR